MCAEPRSMPADEDDLPADPAHPGADAPALSGRIAVLRSGQHLADIAHRLRGLEAILIEAEGAAEPSADRLRRARRTRLQAMDLILQELAGLSGLLVQVARYASDQPDPAVDALVDAPRLQSLSQALRATQDRAQEVSTAPGIVLF